MQQLSEVSVHSALSFPFCSTSFSCCFCIDVNGVRFFDVCVLQGAGTGARTITIYPSNTSVVRTYLFTQLDYTHSYTVGVTVTFTVTLTITFTCITTIGRHLQEQLCLHSCESETNEKRVV